MGKKKKRRNEYRTNWDRLIDEAVDGMHSIINPEDSVLVLVTKLYCDSKETIGHGHHPNLLMPQN